MAEKLTFHQISEQHDNDPTIEPTVLLQRSNGEIQTARLTTRQDERGRYYAAFTDIENGAPVDKLKPLSREVLSDEYQAGLAEELADALIHDEVLEDTAERPRVPDEIIHEAGEAALELAGIEEPSQAHREAEEAVEKSDNAETDTAEIVQSAKVEYTAQTHAIIEDMKTEIGTMLGRMSRDLEEADEQINVVQRVLVDEADQLTQLVAGIESGNMPPVQAMRYIENTQQTLYGMRNRLEGAREVSSNIVRGGRAEAAGDSFATTANVLADRDKGFHDFVRDQNDGVTPPEVAHLSTDEVRSDMQRVRGMIDEAMPEVARANSSLEEAGEQLMRTLRSLDGFVASRGAYGIEDLQRAAAVLRSIDVSRSGLNGAAELIEDARRKLQTIESVQ
ncbi:hypothetical protein B7Y92_01700 [Candidatus Saccharibacteria bacterium 32-50-13]|nr:MAG: hypothetical protein B7Y92_01700 [Candidatus Saccharibacteria bacterium 32-50-13]